MSWWALDVAAYALSRPCWLDKTCGPSLDADDVIRWVERTGLPWAAGSANLAAAIPWNDLAAAESEVELVVQLLRAAAAESLVETLAGFSLRGGSVGLAARRRLPLTTLHQFVGDVPAALDDDSMADHLGAGCADGHVHQGASLPLELMVHWIADAMPSLGYPSESDGRLPWESIDKPEKLRPEPLLLLLSLAKSAPATEDVTQLARLALAAARGDEASWYELRGQQPMARRQVLLTIDELQQLKRQWFEESPTRWLTIVRVEAIIHACLTQRVPGLDMFVNLFEQLAGMRRHRPSDGGKVEYFVRAIEQHVEATPQLEGLELRLGDVVLTGRRGRGERRLQADITEALLGYQSYLRSAEREVKVTFPFGLIRTAPEPIGKWRFNSLDLYRLVEEIIELLERHDGLGKYVDGVDVCGLENDAPAWLFRPAYEWLARWAAQRHRPLTFRCHAGEWFFHPIQGLRSIDDFLSMELGSGRRIGHALALGSADWDRLGAEPLVELFDDLVWALARMSAIPGQDDLVRTLEARCRALLPLVFPDLDGDVLGVGDPAPVLWKAYRARGDIQTLVRVGYLERQGARLRCSGARPSPGRDGYERLACAALRIDGVNSAKVADAGLNVMDMRNILEDCYVALRSYVIERIKRLQAVVEVCPTSNVLTGGVRGYHQHPLGMLAREGVRVTVNSDDPSLFHSFLRDEIRHVLPLLGDTAGDVIARGRDIVGNQLQPASLQADLEAVLEQLRR